MGLHGSDAPSPSHDNSRHACPRDRIPMTAAAGRPQTNDPDVPVSGVRVALVGHRGYPELLSVRLFVLGAGLSLALCAFSSGAHRDDHGNISSPSAVVFNLVPAAVVRLSTWAVGFIVNRQLGFFAAGAAADGLYVAIAAVFFQYVQRRSGRTNNRRKGSRHDR
jgi:hypothetical protein